VGTSISNSGLILTPLMLTSVVGSVFSGQLVARLGKYKRIAISGMVVSLAGSLLLLRLNLHSTNTDVVIAMLVMGLGMGFGMSLYTLIVQNAMPTRIGQATSTLTFFRSIGSTVALAAMGSLMNTAYLPAFQAALPPTIKQRVPTSFLAIFDNPQVLLSADTLTKLHKAATAQGPQGVAVLNTMLEAAKTGLAQGIHNVFLLSAVIMVFGLIALFFLKEIPLRGGRAPSSTAAKPVEETAPMAIGQ
jgi:MFS family permease